MKPTCRKDACRYWKKFKKTCPFFSENVFFEKGEPITLEDCDHKRAVEIAKDIHDLLLKRTVALQKASENERNAFHRVLGRLADLGAPQMIEDENGS